MWGDSLFPLGTAYTHGDMPLCAVPESWLQHVRFGAFGILRVAQWKEELAALCCGAPYRYDRCFCRLCGTAIGEPEAGATFLINAHCLDDDPQVRVTFNEFVSDKPPWEAICDDAVQFANHPFKREQ